MRAWGLALVVSLAALPAWADGSELVGTWIAREEGWDLRVTFHADGRIEVVERGPSGTETTRGTYAIERADIVVKADGAEIRYPHRFEEGGWLVVRDEDGTWIRMRRETSAPPAAPDPEVPRSFVPYALMDTHGLQDLRNGRPLEIFRMLIPKGWRFEGGIQWKIHLKDVTRLTREDLANPAQIAFRVVSPDGAVWLEVYPEIRFADLTAAPAASLFPPGRPYGGMVSMPVMDPLAYVASVVLPKFRPGITSATIADRRDAPELAAHFVEEARRFDAAAGAVGAGTMRIAASAVTYEYDRGGAAYREQFLVALGYLQTPGITLWSARAGWSIAAPREKLEAYLPALMACVYSIQFRPLWFLRYMKLVHENWRGIAETDDVIAKIDAEIVRSRVATTHKINKEVQLVLLPYVDFANPTGGPPVMLPSAGPHYMDPRTGEVEPGRGTGPHPRADDPNWKKLEPVR